MIKSLFTAALAATVTLGGMAATPAAAQDYGRGYYDARAIATAAIVATAVIAATVAIARIGLSP